MAQASSAQREPSMEEILASIRRIIEDSDQGRKPGDGLQRFDAPSERAEGAVIEVDAFRAELRGRTERDPALRLADAALADAVALGETKAKEKLETPHGQAPSGTPSEEGQAKEPQPVAGPLSGSEARSHDPQLVQSSNEPGEADVSTQVDARANVVARAGLISEQPGRQVAAAFSELSEAFAASRRKSFDEMAEEMLRPMLQEWLDNNLPILVERLVREEIERVARGG